METSKNEKIVILGMSDKEERYSFKAYLRLLDRGYKNLIGVSPKAIDLPHIELTGSLDGVKPGFHTLTLYVGAVRLEPMVDKILQLSPKRIIMNPGTENVNLMTKAREAGIEVVEGCTLVMLGTDQF